jgi:thymidylate synthase
MADVPGSNPGVATNAFSQEVVMTYSRVPQSYEDLLRIVRDQGSLRTNRTGTDTIGLFAPPPVTYRDVGKSFPLITTKRIHFASVLHELIWLISGETNIKYLKDNNVSIWDAWADWSGDLGPVYGKQWRSWPVKDSEWAREGVDQLIELVDRLRTDPYSRRHIVSAWNVAELSEMALPPCHMMFQVYVRDEAGGEVLDMQMYQRSADMFLGVPFNIASYSLLLIMLARLVGMRAGNLTHVLGDAHIYVNHLDQVATQLAREPKDFPVIELNPLRDFKSIDDFRALDVVLVGYEPHQGIKAQVAV